jgi:hypothetical protein
MEFQRIRTQIIDKIITPFFENNGFNKEGKYYFMKRNHVKIVVEIIYQECYEKVIIENILINIKVYLNNSNELPPFMCFKSYNIDLPEISWIRIIEEMDMEKLTLLLNNKLKELLVVLNNYNSIEKIIKIGKDEIIKLNGEKIELKNQLETQTDNQSQNDVLKIALTLNERRIELINDWIQKRTM